LASRCDLAAHLHQVGRRHARRALKLYTSTDEFEMLDAAFSVGSAVELLAKSLLASVLPMLLLSATPLASYLAMCKRLKNHLSSLELAKERSTDVRV